MRNSNESLIYYFIYIPQPLAIHPRLEQYVIFVKLS